MLGRRRWGEGRVSWIEEVRVEVGGWREEEDGEDGRRRRWEGGGRRWRR